MLMVSYAALQAAALGPRDQRQTLIRTAWRATRYRHARLQLHMSQYANHEPNSPRPSFATSREPPMRRPTPTFM